AEHGIREPDRAVRLHHHVVGRVEPLAVEAVDQHRDGAVVLRARHAAPAVRAADEPALAVAGVAVGEVGGLAVDAHRPRLLLPLEDAVVGDVAPQQVAPVAEVDRPLRPAAAGVETLHAGELQPVFLEGGIERDDGRIGIARGLPPAVGEGRDRGSCGHWARSAGNECSCLDETISRHSLVAPGFLYLEMLLEVHATVQDGYDVDAALDAPVEEDVRAGGILPVAPSDFVTGAAPARFLRDRLYRFLHDAKVVLRLLRAPSFHAVGPNVLEVGTSARREDIAAHVPAFAPRLLLWRLRSMNSSKSKGVEGPLCSPSISAARRASTLISRSSSRRSPARTTSLAEP